MSRELDRTASLNLELSPEWIELRGVIVAALEPHPDARRAIFDALEERDNDGH